MIHSTKCQAKYRVIAYYNHTCQIRNIVFNMSSFLFYISLCQFETIQPCSVVKQECVRRIKSQTIHEPINNTSGLHFILLTTRCPPRATVSLKPRVTNHVLKKVSKLQRSLEHPSLVDSIAEKSRAGRIK